jgi:hypothetical protein
MALDNYALCPCGSGKKVKWCSPKVLPEVQRVAEMAEDGQPESALRLLHKLAEQHPEPNCLRMYIDVNIATVELMLGRHDAGMDRLKNAAEACPESGLPCSILAIIYERLGDAEEVVSCARRAFNRFPAEMASLRAKAALDMAASYLQLGRPIAAQAAWQQAAKIEPSLQASEPIDKQLERFPGLPRAVKRGLTLRSPDEFAMFNDERREKWDRALGGEREWRLEHAAEAFEALVADDPADLCARYNLAVVYAWLGDNSKAWQAFDEYVKLETDDRAASDAWEIALVLTLADGMAEFCDTAMQRADYAIRDEEAFEEVGAHWRRLAVFGPSNEKLHLAFVTDRPHPDPADLPAGRLIGADPKLLARWSRTDDMVNLESFTHAELELAKQAVVEHYGDLLEPVEEWTDVNGFPWRLFHSVLLARHPEASDAPEELAAFRTRKLEEYYETTWLAEPLRSLGNISPRDAAGSKILRRKLEAAIRREESICRGFHLTYNFDRLRNKLGLTSLIPEGVRSEDSPLPISSYSAAQLADLDPAKLEDDKLLEAYAAANSHDIPLTALRFAKELTKRPDAAPRIDMMGVFRRLTLDALEHRKFADAAAFVDAALAYDAAHYGKANAGVTLALKARCLAVEGQRRKAAEVYRQIVLEHPKELKYGVEAVEAALRDADWPLAKELADLGLKRAQDLRERSLQEQFRELGREAAARSR